MADKAYDPIQKWAIPLDMGDYKFQSWNIAAAVPEDKEGFHGTIYTDNFSCAVVAFAGTKDAKDLKADAKIVLNRLPNQSAGAMNLYQSAKEMMESCCGGEIWLTGHSLGGALAQIVSALTGKRFVSFNSPCMKESLAKIPTMKNLDPSTVNGVNVRMKNDPVSDPKWGTPVGKIIELDKNGKVGNKMSLTAHFMDKVIAQIKMEGLSSLDATTAP
jgi:hypothetical protein